MYTALLHKLLDFALIFHAATCFKCHTYILTFSSRTAIKHDAIFPPLIAVPFESKYNSNIRSWILILIFLF